CDGAPSVSDGTVSLTSTTTTFGSTASVNCDSGYDSSADTITCQASGVWQTPTCTIKDCMIPRSFPHGDSDTSNGTTFGSIASIRCEPGYTLQGDQFTELCRNLTYPQNGYIDTSQKSVAVYSCITGYEVNGSSTLICTIDGHWDKAIPTCTIKDCGVLQDPANGQVTYARNMTSYGSNATYSCQSGYDISGPNIIYCNASGHWSDNTTYCQIKDCKNLTDPPNGKADMSNGTTYKSVGTYSCNTGYTLRGENRTICTQTGKWSIHRVNCIINGTMQA
ncbi:P-selectin-like, partial [Mercenaria mercenaria]|uniref:P-selectin-like n=1 Tax=Mercenaria mercenaria TaxID=6596 RepID=UPI00234F1898